METLFTLEKNIKNYIFTYILTIKCKKSFCGVTPLPCPILLGFTVVSDQLKEGEHSKCCGLLPSAVPVSIPNNIWSQAKHSTGDGRSLDGSALLLFLSDR